MEFLQRPLAITDVETTGLDFKIHEIIELGLLVVNQKTLEVVDEFETKIKPANIETAEPKALQLNGYNEQDWVNALDLGYVMGVYSKKTREAIFLAHNVTFDWSFIFEAFRKTNAANLMDYHRVDLFTCAWAKASRLPGLKKFNLDELCKYFGIPPEPVPHRAINGVRNELKVLKKLLEI